MVKPDVLRISGAGPSGLAAAITAARAGLEVEVHERAAGVGHRFHGDFQGLENWTTPGDVLEELAGLGIEPTFEHTPCRELVCYEPSGREHIFRFAQPLYYLVRRGTGAGTVDTALAQQAEAAGVTLRLGSAVQHLPEGGIVAQGPRGADIIAVGYLFDTDMPDGAFGALGDDRAPAGYAYLLVNRGRGTVASCIFRDFHREREYLERTVDFFTSHAGLRMTAPRRFGGLGNVTVPASARHGRLLQVGEAAGFQDALWGFGMRYAMLSGALAARAWADGRPESYDDRWRDRLGGLLRTGLVNRRLFSRLGDGGYTRFLRWLDRAPDPRAMLERHYRATWWKTLLWTMYGQRSHSNRVGDDCVLDGCDCTWCRCGRDHAGDQPVVSTSRA